MFCEKICSKIEGRVRSGECLQEDLAVAELNEAKLDWRKYEQSFTAKNKYLKNKKQQ